MPPSRPGPTTRAMANCAPRLRLFNDLHLRAVGAFDKADVPAVVRRQFLQNAHAILLEPGQCPRIVVGLHGHVLDAVVLLVILRSDKAGDVELQPMQIDRKPRPGISSFKVAPKLST